MRVLVSCPWVSPWMDVDLPAGWEARSRAVDLDVGPFRASVGRVRDMLRTVLAARRFDALVVSTSSTDLLLAIALRPLMGRCRLVAYDPLQPSSPRLRSLVSRWMSRRLDLTMVVRRSDLAFWAHGRPVFVPFLAPDPTTGAPAAAVPRVTVYAAGDAHRDYDLLTAALALVDVDATIATRQPVTDYGNPRLTVIPAVSPEDGRRHQRESGITAVLLEPTDRPAGPLVLLDAMAAGAAVVCTRSAGLVDYVEDGVTAVMLSSDPTPGEVADRLRELIESPELRERLGVAARAAIAGDLSAGTTLRRCRELLESLP